MQRAIDEGADFIETDILATRDGALICFHDVYLDDLTDVIQHKEFADRKRTYEVQGYYTTGFFTGGNISFCRRATQTRFHIAHFEFLLVFKCSLWSATITES